MEQRFCSVFKFKKRIFLARQKKANGPRLMVFPPIELFAGLDTDSLAEKILDALDGYGQTDRPILASEWEKLNNELLSYFGEKSVSAFERKKKEITIKQDMSLRRFFALDSSGAIVCESASITDIAEAVYNAIGKPSVPSPGKMMV